jgi:ABC-type transport system involved in multi-copper enzyme maturation permease subunit
MATSRAIKKPKRDDTQLSNWQPMPERAPSVEVSDRPTVARIVAMIGLFLTVLGTLAMFAPMWQRTAAISPDWGFRFATIGVCLILYHTFVDRDLQFRRLYGFLGLALMIGGVVLRLMAFRTGFAAWFPLYGFPALTIGLIFAVAVLRNETDLSFRNLLLNCLGIEGGLMIAFSALMGMRDANFLPGEGTVLLLLGLAYVGAYIGQQEAGSDRAYYAALAIGGIGLLGLLAGLFWSFWQSSFLVPRGLILIGMSIVYLAVSIGICCDWPVVVIARRDLAGYFYSPIGYLVVGGLILVSGFMFLYFVENLVNPLAGPVFEPIIDTYIHWLLAFIVQMFILPVLTMRLLSEERRTGTLEVLMTAPVNETTVVLGKFLASWTFYMLTWLPWWLNLVSLRYIGGETFDYLPAISFMAAVAVIGAGLLSMGLFFSSITSNQIIAAVLTFVGMMMHLVFWLLKFFWTSSGDAIQEALRAINFIDLWQSSMAGIVSPRYLMFHASVAIFFLFATVKVLESRKWK